MSLPISRRPKFEIVITALRRNASELKLELPDGRTVGWLDGKLCQILFVWISGNYTDSKRECDEERWVESDIPFNTFDALCEQLSDETIATLVFQATRC